MSFKIQFTTLAVATTLALAPHAKAASAPTPSDTGHMSVRVSVADLDLSQQAGANAALHRIHRAAVFICGDEPASSGLFRYGLDRDCRKAATERALMDLHAQIAATGALRSAPTATALAANR